MASSPARSAFCYGCDGMVSIETPELVCPTCGCDFLELRDEEPVPYLRAGEEQPDVAPPAPPPALVIPRGLGELLHRMGLVGPLGDGDNLLLDLGGGLLPGGLGSDFRDYVADGSRRLEDILTRLGELGAGEGMTPLSPERIAALPTVTTERAGQSCAICQDEFAVGTEVTRLPCPGSHDYCTTCIGMWLERCATCPVCRFDLNEAEDDTSIDYSEVGE